MLGIFTSVGNLGVHHLNTLFLTGALGSHQLWLQITVEATHLKFCSI